MLVVGTDCVGPDVAAIRNRPILCTVDGSHRLDHGWVNPTLDDELVGFGSFRVIPLIYLPIGKGLLCRRRTVNSLPISKALALLQVEPVSQDRKHIVLLCSVIGYRPAGLIRVGRAFHSKPLLDAIRILVSDSHCEADTPHRTTIDLSSSVVELGLGYAAEVDMPEWIEVVFIEEVGLDKASVVDVEFYDVDVVGTMLHPVYTQLVLGIQLNALKKQVLLLGWYSRHFVDLPFECLDARAGPHIDGLSLTRGQLEGNLEVGIDI